MGLPASDAPLHPLDIEQARGYYLVAMLLRFFVSPTVLLSAMLLLWTVSNNALTPVVGPIIGLTLVAYVERRFRTDAWAYIPRRRQDLGRDEPIGLALLVRSVEVAFLAGTVTSFVSSVGVRPVPTRVASIALGLLLGLILIAVAALLWDRSAPRDHRFAPAPTPVGTLATTSTLIVVTLGSVTLARRITVDMPETLIGFAILAGATTLWLLLRLIPARVRCLPAGIDL
jgi:hypothetical protein